MSQPTESKKPGPDAGKTGADRLTRTEESRPTHIYLVPYPKIVFLYPTFLVALVAAIWMWATGRRTVSPEDTTAVVITWVFLAVAGVNILVLAFDFPRATWLTMMFLLAALALGGVLIVNLRPGLLPAVAERMQTIRPVANSTFFAMVSVFFLLIYGAVLISVRFDYWEVRPNELLHHHGLLSDLKRFSAPNLRIDKEINDVFEYLLLGSGRLILQPSGERRAIILDNVLFISRKETEITRMLGALQVQFRPE